MKRTLIIISLFFALAESVVCQELTPDSILMKLVNTFKDPGGLSFDVQYKYATENEPSRYQDSLDAHCVVQGMNAWYKIDQTTTISNAEYSIMIFNEDALIYINKPQINEKNHSPVGFLDSLTRSNPEAKSSVRSSDQNWELTILLPSNSSYKKIVFTIDKKSGLLKKSVAVVKSDLLYDGTEESQGKPKDEYANIETYYFNYQRGNINPEIFKTDNYFLRTGSDFIPAKAYQSYKIFKGTTNL